MAAHPGTVSELILVNPIAAPALEGPKGLMTKLAVLYYEAAARLPRRLGQGLLRSQLIVRVMSETMAKTRDKQLRRFVHAQHSAYFSAFADRESLLEAFKASVGSNVAEVAGSLTLPVLLIAGEKDEIADAAGPAHAAGPAAGRAPGRHPRRRPPDPLRNPGTRRGLHPPLPEGPLRVKILIDARFTRLDHHDGISRYGASLIAATAKIADVSMLISDVRQLALLPDVPYTLINSPLSPAELFVAGKVNKLGADVVVCPMQTMGSWGRKYALVLTLHDLIYYEHPAPPGFLPAPVRVLWRLYHKAFWPQRLLLNRADVVATISSTTAALISKYRLTRRPVRIVGNAPQHGHTPRDPGAGADKTLLYMGSFMPYKNVETMIRGMAELPGHDPAPAEPDHPGTPGRTRGPGAGGRGHRLPQRRDRRRVRGPAGDAPPP